MLEGILILWVALTLLSLAYLTYDLALVTPEAGVMKVGWWLLTLYTGPIGLFFYLLTCKEPMPGTHEAFIRPLWKQSMGSMVHCLAGDVTGIILAAIVLTFFTVPLTTEIIIEYIAGFAFGLFIFQSLFMKSSMGGSYGKALKTSLYPEWLSMNMIMAGMIPVMVIWGRLNPESFQPFSMHFFGKMSLATIVGGVIAYPINYWLVMQGLKHGMMTVRKETKMHIPQEEKAHMHMQVSSISPSKKLSMALFSVLALIIGILIAIGGYYSF